MEITQSSGSVDHTSAQGAGRSLEVDAFIVASDHVLTLIEAVPEGSWGTLALGSWDVRSLVGHIARAMSTVVDYLARPVPDRTVMSAVDYYLAVSDHVDPDAVRVRGEQAGLDLGDQPLASVRETRDRAVTALSQLDDRIVSTAVGGMLLSDFLLTRTFELAVHALDLALATDQPETLPDEVLDEVLQLATELTVRRGAGEALLLALTGRRSLRGGFTVL